MENVIIYHDFDDIATAEIYCLRFLETAKILELRCNIATSKFGFNKIHAKITVSGNTKDIEMFQDFVGASLKLINNNALVL